MKAEIGKRHPAFEGHPWGPDDPVESMDDVCGIVFEKHGQLRACLRDRNHEQPCDADEMRGSAP